MARRSVPPAPDAPRTTRETASITPLPLIQLVRQRQDTGTVNLLRELLAQAEAGKIAGLVVVGLFPAGSDRKYDVKVSGLAAVNTTLAVGAVDVCHMLLQEKALEESGLT